MRRKLRTGRERKKEKEKESRENVGGVGFVRVLLVRSGGKMWGQ